MNRFVAGGKHKRVAPGRGRPTGKRATVWKRRSETTISTSLPNAWATNAAPSFRRSGAPGRLYRLRTPTLQGRRTSAREIDADAEFPGGLAGRMVRRRQDGKRMDLPGPCDPIVGCPPQPHKTIERRKALGSGTRRQCTIGATTAWSPLPTTPRGHPQAAPPCALPPPVADCARG